MNFPGSFAWSANWLFSFHTVPAISGTTSSFTGLPSIIAVPSQR